METIKFTPANPTIGWLHKQSVNDTPSFRDFCKMAQSDAFSASRWLAAAVRIGYEDFTMDRLTNTDLDKIISATMA